MQQRVCSIVLIDQGCWKEMFFLYNTRPSVKNERAYDFCYVHISSMFFTPQVSFVT